MTAAESPDGAVFAAPQDPTSPSPSVAWVDRRQRPGADRRARADRHRRAGRRRHQLLRGDVLDAVRLQPHEREPGRAVDHAVGADGEQLEQRPRRARRGERPRLRLGHPGQHRQRLHRQPEQRSRARTCSCSGLGDAIGSDGSVYYERTDHHLVARRPNGATAVGPLLADTPNGLGGGVQYLDVVAGGAVWVSEPAGQGLDATYTTYDAATLHSARVLQRLGDEHRRGLQRRRPGARVRRQRPGLPEASPSTPTSCVFNIVPQGSVSNAVGVGSAVTLLGPTRQSSCPTPPRVSSTSCACPDVSTTWRRRRWG